MLLFGASALGDVELIALVLGGGRGLWRALAVLDREGGVGGLARACPHELCGVPGIGVAGATALVAAFELGRRAAAVELPLAAPIRGPSDVEAYARLSFGDALQETFVALGLDARQRVRLVRTIAVGSVSQVDVHPREVFRPLVRAGMHSVVVVHNHPSGEPEPSQADIELTLRLVGVGATLGIPLVDHVIVTRTRSLSFAARHLLPEAAR